MTQVANSVVVGSVYGKVFGISSGMTASTWAGDSPRWVASAKMPPRSRMPVRATSDIRKTRTSSMKIVRCRIPQNT